MKSFVVPVLKIIVGVGLIFWLIDSGKLDIKQLKVFFTSWHVTLSAFIHYFLVGVLLGSLRLNLLLEGLGVQLKLSRLVRFQFIGLFFNVAMPGAVGGDLVKGVYVIKENENKNRTHVMMAILIDRISGMTGLFTIGMIAVLFNFTSLWSNNLIKPTLLMVVGLFVAMIVLHLLAIRKTSDENDFILKILNRGVPGFSIIKKIYLSFREFRNHPSVLFKAWFFSMAIQLLTFGYFCVIASNVIPDFANYSGLATVFPIGVFTSVIPISPGGLGVGHLAFERLIDLIGYKGGANVFNIYVLGYMALCLCGLIPYLTNKKKIDISEINEFEEAASTGGAS